jgi:hypothetical protein
LRLLTTFISSNYYTNIYRLAIIQTITGIHYVYEYRMNNAIVEQTPCFLLFPFLIPFCPPFVSLYLLGTLLAVIGSCPPRSQVARKLISPFPSPSPYTPHSKIPTPWGFPELNMLLLRRHREPGSQDPEHYLFRENYRIMHILYIQKQLKTVYYPQF